MVARRENRHQAQFGVDAVRRRLQGIVDPRGTVGILSRGKNVYMGGLPHARSGGGPGIGHPVGSGDVNKLASAMKRRMGQRSRSGR